jgi:hypothetical protein
MMFGGVMPGGIERVAVFVTLLICAIAPPMSAPCSKYTLTMPMPLIVCDSSREMPLTVVDSARSVISTTRRSMSSADRPG